MACPQCQTPLRVRTEYVGKRIACKTCDHTFRVEAPPDGAAPPPAPPAAAGEGAGQEVQQLREELAARTSEHDRALQQLQEAQAELAGLRGQVHDLQNQLEQARAEHDRL